MSHREQRSRQLLRQFVVPAVFASCLLGPSASDAQPPAPVIKYVFPQGGQRGQSVAATVSGTDLQGVNTVRITGGGVAANVVKVENPTTVRISATIAPDAQLGERDIRVVSPAGGVSNRFRFFVGDLPEINEKEPNSLPNQAQPLESLPLLVNGQILPSDRDIFRFAAKAGQTLVCEVHARKLFPYISDAVPGWLQAYVTLYDADGRQLAAVDDYRFHPDPVLIYKVPKDGEYLLEVRDLVYRGRADFVYRLAVAQRPFVTHLFPLGGQRNSETQVELHGVNLPTPSMTIKLPADSPPVHLVQLSHNGLRSNILPFAAGDTAESREAEPNDFLPQANRVAVPMAVNGRIQRSGDADCFRFAAKKGQRLIVEVQARRLESPLDSIITLFNSQGGELQVQDDTDMGEPLLTHHADSRMDYTFPADGDYIVRIKDVQTHGRDDYAYRLCISPPRPDFVLRTIPDNPRLGPSDTAMVTVKVLRKDGFNGEIRLAVQNLPNGFVASPAVIPAGQSEMRLTITAPPDAAAGVFSPTIAGTATIGEQAVSRTAVGAEHIMQAFSLKHDVPTKEFLMAVTESAFFTLSTNIPPTEVREVRQGTQLAVVVKASRQGLKAAVQQAEAEKKTAEEALAKVKQDLAKAKTDYDAAEKAAKTAEAAAKTISADAGKSAEEKKQAADEAAAKRQAAKAAKTAVDRLTNEEKAANTQLTAANKALEAARARAKLEIKLTADALPKGVTAKLTGIPADKDQATVTFNIAKQAAEGLRQNIVLTGTLGSGDDIITHVAPALPIRVVAPPPLPKK